ncbi:hypothetical protein [Fusobacterium sp.]|uniref:hypothetical protein n=1 Tax=Fusobacterium sp. TaxID=68766 RepID=UPI002E75E05A|nr:hypothetical protein [Fusobacterium sp.]MEE1476273.1 hypothetical protein [Fusobacterium sp.]
MIVNKIIISEVAPNSKEVGWLLPLKDGTFKLKFFGLNDWIDATSGAQGPAGQNGATGPAGTDGKSVKAIKLATNAEGAVIGGTATLSDESIINITVTTSEA